MKLDDRIRDVPGVGPKRERALNDGGIFTVEDLLAHFPKQYIDRSRRGTFAAPSETAVTIEACVSRKGTVRRIRRNLSLFGLSVTTDDGVTGQITFFNQPWLAEHFHEEARYYFFGRITEKKGKCGMANPQFVPTDKPGNFFELTPVYAPVGGVSGETLRKLIAKVLAEDIAMSDPLPETLRKDRCLPNSAACLKLLHCPQTMAEVAAGRTRLKFEEALKLNLGLLRSRGETRRSSVVLAHPASLSRFERGLPFLLTEGQRRVLAEIAADLQSGRIMNRLVQGDVGSGKTVVAVACAYLMALGGYQCAYMAPTEILAEQHARNFEAYLAPYGISVTLVTGSMKASERENALTHIANGDAQVIIGTHALFQKDMAYYNLGMVITDEQHRFGVRQRGLLALKGERPHTLVMSATPIPRTLALVLYGDLDISVIDTMPAGRKKVKTYFYTEKALRKILGMMAVEMAAGHQGFIVCPFVENAEEMAEVRDTQTVCREVDRYYKGLYRVACLHGKMKPDEKAAVVADFSAGKIDCLVATSIIEVGIDVPNVTMMVVMSADRFGLSQLHQLRGRVGRGDAQAYCFLVSNAVNEKTIARMKVIVNHHNGQEIAEADFKLRGPGDAFGTRQHGLPALSALDPTADAALLAETRAIAEQLLASPKAEDMACCDALTRAFDHGVEQISMN